VKLPAKTISHFRDSKKSFMSDFFRISNISRFSFIVNSYFKKYFRDRLEGIMYDKFEKLLNERGVTPYRVHKETGISTATLSDWKNGKSQPKKDKIEKICEYFNVPLSYFYGEEESE